MHDAGIAGPLRSWERKTVGLAALIAVAAVVGGALTVLYFVMSSALSDRSVAALPGWVLDLLRHSSTIDTVYLVTALAYIAALAWWRRETYALLMVFGNGDLGALGNKLLKIWIVFLFLALTLRFVANSEPVLTSDDLASRLETAAFAFGLRVVALLLLLVAVGQVRSRVRATVVAVASQPPSAVEA